jgi:hypothetical protein
MDIQEYCELVKSIAEQCINELCPATLDNVKRAIKRSHDRANELAKNKSSAQWTQKDMDNSVKEFKQQQYADRKFAVNCSFRDKLNYIKETIATMMDVQPIMPVGQEHPAKKEKKKENKCQEQ